MGMFGGLLMLPQYLQVVKGMSPTMAGLGTLPMTIGMMTGSIISGQTIARTARYKIFPVIGTALLVVAMVLFHFVTATTPLWHTMIVMLIMGLGLGGNMQPVILAVQNAVAPREIGVATSSVTFSRQMGGTLGTAVFLSILFSVLTSHIANALRAATQTAAWKAAAAAHPAQIHFLQSGAGNHALSDTSFIQKLDPALAAPFKAGFAQSMDLVFLVAAVIVAIGLVIIWQLPELPLRMESGNAARAAERQQAAADEGLPAGVAAEDGVPPASDEDLMGIPSAVAPDAVAPGSTPR
jgi:MFS family permease